MHARVDDHLRARATLLPIRLGASAGPPRVVYHPCQSLTLGVLQTRHPAAPRAGAEGFDLCEAMACIAMRTSPFPSRLGPVRATMRQACVQGRRGRGAWGTTGAGRSSGANRSSFPLLWQ